MEPNLPRPESALARGIKITEFSGSRVNPEPVTFEESDILLEEYLSPRRLRELTGVDDLDKVHFLELKVNTSDTSLGNFGVNIPQLLQLKLSNSIIPSFRDLGSSLNNVRVLWMAQCGLMDLESVSSMSGLRELYLAYNELTDISPCSMLDELRILDVEGNNITEISQVEFLALCQNLTHLTLEGNPVCLTPYPDQAVPDYDYRKAVRTALPQLKYLDDESMETVAHSRPSTSKPPMSGFEEDWKLLQELMEDGIVISADNDTDSTGRRPATACRPNSALRPYTSTGLRPWSSIKTASPTGRPRTGIRPGSRAGTARPGSAAALGTAGRVD
ncbi:hypothetical protein NP493_1220g00077 [Ridgeia piscesae]|uniref:Leucine-rich repeat-containing protein 56 n=1 Tax=Ridgeia piscesae TaxID=27915 RepID=A0AAD9KBG1_RIDPI|nr:hypothetical protein NP493_1220g00077 [Ridgeia piscesae]